MQDSQAFYDEIAELYNRDWGGEYLDTASRYFMRYVRPQVSDSASVLDICCGSGQFAALMTKKGFHVTGVDLSPGLLVHAAENAPESVFVAGEMSRFRLGTTFDAAVCCYNSLNHATSASHLRSTLRNVRRHLLPGAPFLADVLLAGGYAWGWDREATIESSGGPCDIRFRYDAKRSRAICDATVGDRTVSMRQSVFSLEELKEAFAAAGLAVSKVLAVRTGRPASGRVVLLASRE